MALNFLSRGSMKGEKATMKTSLMSDATLGSIFRLTMRFFQLLLAIVVIGLYAQDLDRAHKAGVGYDKKWMFATITGVLASLWAIVCSLPLVKAWFFFYIDFVFFILYMAAFGTFGNMFINEDPEGNKGIQRMKNAVWVLLTNMLLWLTTASYGAFIFWKHHKARTPLTGRGEMHV